MDAFDINIEGTDGVPMVYNTLTRNFSKVSSVMSNNNPLDEKDIEGFRAILKEALLNDPQAVTILPTTNCNARCWYCYEHGIQRCDMTIENAEHVVSFISDYFEKPELTINWFGGEPLLGFDVIRHITTRLKEKGFCLTTCLTTNGSLLNEDMVSFLKDNYTKVNVNITIDGIKEDYADVKKYINIPKELAFDKVIDNVKLLLKYKIFVHFRINFDDINKAEKVYAYLNSELDGVDNASFHVCYAPIWKKESDMEQFRIDAMTNLQYINNGLDINVLANPFMDNILINSVANTKRLGHCVALSKNNMVINADGKLYRCHSLVCDEKYACGNVTTGLDVSALGYLLFEKKHENQCGGCALLPLCSTQCRIRSILYGDETVCNNTKTIVPEIAKMKLRKRQSEKNKIFKNS